MLLRYVLLIGAFYISLGCTTLRAASLEIAVSIKPLYSLLAHLVEKDTHLTLLVPEGASPHTYTLAPQKAQAVFSADLIFWVGPLQEPFLEPFLKKISNHKKQKICSFMHNLPHLKYLPVRTGPLWAHCSHHPLGLDPHIWLDPHNAIQIATIMCQMLCEQDPDHKEAYENRLAALIHRLEALDVEIHKMFETISQGSQALLLFHDALQYFEARYGLKSIGAISVHLELPLQAKRLALIEAALSTRTKVCLLKEPEFNAQIAKRLQERFPQVTTVSIDILGSRIPHRGPEAYFEIMRDLAWQVSTCLAKPS